MKKISLKKIPVIPASHERRKNPGALKKILFTKKDFEKGTRIQMINWAILPPLKKFQAHYHEDMEEIFIILSGKVKIWVGKEMDLLKKGDVVLIPKRKIHSMENISKQKVDYLVIGLSLGRGGKTITI